MKTKEEILECMKKICSYKGYIETDKISKIANAKAMMLGEDWIHCPCDPENKARFCISKKCQSDIEENGVCHCGCYKKV